MSRWPAVFAFNEYERDRWVARQASLVAAGARVLDVGAGTCPYRSLFAHCEYRSHDFGALPPDDLRGGRGYGPIDYVSDIAHLPVPDGSFDVVLCTEVLEHVPDPGATVREFARVLASGGTLLLTAPLGSGLHQMPYHFYGGFTPSWYQRFLADAGFRDVTVEPNGGFFKHYGQESQRFAAMIRPSRQPGRRWASMVAWLALSPWMRVVVPVLCHLVDGWDGDRGFTVGYFVRAARR